MNGHALRIFGRSGLSTDVEVWLDGKRLQGVQSVSFEVQAFGVASATIVMQSGDRRLLSDPTIELAIEPDECSLIGVLATRVT